MKAIAIMVFIPVSWLIATLIAAMLAVPVYFLLGWLGQTYLAFVPAVYLTASYLEIVGLFVLFGTLKMVVLKK